MDLKKLIEEANLQIKEDKILYNEPMKKYTTFKIGGNAECLIKITNNEDLIEILKFANKNNIKVTVIGNGSNVLISDNGIKGITLIIKIEKLEINKENESIKVTIGAGEKIAKIGMIFAKQGIEGFEEIAGIPGTIGGATRMNAGAYGKEMKDIIKNVKCVDYAGNERIFTNKEMDFSYRTSILKKEKYIVTQVEIELKQGDEKEIRKKMDGYREKRMNSQPLEYPNAGSTFKRGNDFITAKLIDEAGLKGMKVGDAEVSTKHRRIYYKQRKCNSKRCIRISKKSRRTDIYKI